MKFIGKIVMTGCFGFWSFVAIAQQGKDVYDHLLIKIAQEGTSNASVEEYEGTPYLNDEFISGTVYINEGKFDDVPLRYNIFRDLVEFKKNNQIYFLDADGKIDMVTIGNDTLVVEDLLIGKSEKPVYFKMIAKGKASLLSRLNVKYRAAQPPKPPAEPEGKLAKYTRFSDDFYLKAEGELIKIDNVKKVIQQLPSAAADLESFAKKNKISRNEEDLKKLINHYNNM
jgi:hypothetical protein